MSNALSNSPLGMWVDYKDLKQAKIVPNWQTLKAWQDDPKINFTKGRLFGRNTRRWHWNTEIVPWLESRPIERVEFERRADATELPTSTT